MHSRLLAGFFFVLVAVAPTTASSYFESYPGCHSRDFGATRAMAVAANGDAIVTGCLHGNGNNYDTMLTMKFSGATGAVLWSVQYDGSGAGNDGAAAIAMDASGNAFVTGFSYDAPGKQNIRTVKYDGATGAQLWTAAYEAPSASRANAIAVSTAGDVFVTGESSGEAGGRNIRTVKYSGSTGAQLWTASFNGSVSGFDIGEAIVVDANGDAFVTGLSGETDGGSNFRTIKYRGASGEQLWTQQFGVTGEDSGLDGVIAPDGSFIAAGYTYDTGQGSRYRVFKYNSANGEVLWTTAIGTVPVEAFNIGDTANSVGLDAAGNVFVTGFFTARDGFDMRTVKLDRSTGAVLWNVAYSGAGGGRDIANALAVDGNGDVVITGASDDTASDDHTLASIHNLRTVKYRGSDGAQLWSASYPGESGDAIAADASRDVLVAAHAASLGGYGFTVVKYAAATGARLWSTASAQIVIPTAAPGPLSGIWWNPSESGWGINFTQRNNIVFSAWYTYDASGNPKWYVAPHCALPSASAGGSCSETLYEVTGPVFFGAAFDPSAAQVTAVGTLQLSFTNADNGSMTYTVAGQSRTVAISRQPLPGGSVAPPVDFTDLWWKPSEPGWGVAITHRFNVIFLAWFIYDASGRPVWYVAPNCAMFSDGTGCSGMLYRTTGPAFAATFDPSQVRVFEVGAVTLSFTDPNTGSLSYFGIGGGGFKAITRQVF